MPSLRDLLEKRATETREKRSAREKQVSELNTEIAKLTAELDEITRILGAIPMVNRLETGSPRKVRQPTKPTIKEAVMQVLLHYPNGLTALEILREVNLRFALGIVRTSLSPQLSRLKRDGRIRNAGIVWTVTAPSAEYS